MDETFLEPSSTVEGLASIRGGASRAHRTGAHRRATGFHTNRFQESRIKEPPPHRPLSVSSPSQLADNMHSHVQHIYMGKSPGPAGTFGACEYAPQLVRLPHTRFAPRFQSGPPQTAPSAIPGIVSHPLHHVNGPRRLHNQPKSHDLSVATRHSSSHARLALDPHGISRDMLFT